MSHILPILVFLGIGFLIPFCILTSARLFFQGREGVSWTQGMMKSAGSNISLALINGLMAGGVYALVELADAAYASLGIPYISQSVWDGIPIWVSLAIYLIAIDFADYWNHRLLHTRGFWPIHAVHHSDTDMNFTTSNRVHILESVVMLTSYTVLLSWLGLPAEVGALLVTWKLMYNKFVHIDADIHFGPLTRVFATPRFHRWHHADEPSAYNTNFANIFSFWDVIFGTYSVPGPYKGKLGFEGTPGHNLFELFVLPVRLWGKDIKALRNKPASIHTSHEMT